jgi:hypothetical protein
MANRRIVFYMAIMAALINSSCGGGAKRSSSSNPHPSIRVSVSPSSATVETGKTTQFSAIVSNASNGSATWSATCGSISVTGFYRAPDKPGNCTVTVKSNEDQSKSASATVTVITNIRVSVSPSSATIVTGKTTQFSAIVSNTSNGSVTWSATCGSISVTGLYTAPDKSGNCTVTAKSNEDQSKSASTTVTIITDIDTDHTVCNSGLPVLDNQPPPAVDYMEEVGGVSFDMVYMPGGTFTLGCEGGNCPADTTPVPGVKVSSYHIAKNQVTAALWEAVTGESMGSMVSITWYDAMRFACKLSHQTGRAYRMMTEAEFEYAAKNYRSRLKDIGENSMFGEEWAYNSWELSHMGGTDPVGHNSGKHTQKTRRDIQGSSDNITGRLIRSIDGIGPQLRLVVSNEMEFPPDYVPPCALCPPVSPKEPENSYRDPRWITGSDSHWKEGAIKIGNFDLRAWEDGTAILNGAIGQWFTSNNIAFVFVPSSGSVTKFAYIWLDEKQGSLISDAGFSGGYIGRIEKVSAIGNKPTISGLKSGAELAAEAGDDYKMIDMENIPEWAKKQDQRLIDGPGQCWFQDNSSVGGLHHYRKDVDADEFRFTVNQGQMTMLANGNWFTVNNTFLRITHSSGYTTDYLYALSPDGFFFHNSYQAYERADFRMFQKKSNNESFPPSCGSHCNQEIPKGRDASIYSIIGGGNSTYVPPPCPANGCH